MSKLNENSNGEAGANAPAPEPEKTQPQNGHSDGPLRLITIDGVRWLTDGIYKCLSKVGRYTIDIFRNPSGQLKPRLWGNRPKAALSKVGGNGDAEPEKNPAPPAVATGSGDGAVPLDGDGKQSVRYRRNFDTLQEADAARDDLILDDNDVQKRMHPVPTELTLDQVKDAEAARRVMLNLPAPDWSKGPWTLERVATYVLEHYRAVQNPTLLDLAVEEFLVHETKANLRPASKRDKRSTLNALRRQCPGMFVHQVPEATVSALIFKGWT